MMSNACGVDFGTSNSTVGWLRPDAPTLLPLEDGKATLPSVIFFHAEDPTVSYGRAALADYLAGYEGRLMRSLKSLLGTSMMDDSTEVMGQAMPFGRAPWGKSAACFKATTHASCNCANSRPGTR